MTLCLRQSGLQQIKLQQMKHLTMERESERERERERDRERESKGCRMYTLGYDGENV